MNTDFDDHSPLNTDERRELPLSVFGIPQLRKFPMPDAGHVIMADAYFYSAPEQYKAELARAILARAQEFGVDVRSEKVLEWAQK